MELILHLGAHRTGSTALTRCLRKNDALLLRKGVATWPAEGLRHLPHFGAVPELTGLAAAGRLPADQSLTELRQVLKAEADRLEVTGHRRLILSEENISGLMLANLSGAVFYAAAAARLTAYATVLPRRPAVVALGLRDYASLWPSVHSYLLPRHPLPPFAEVAQALCDTGRGWCDLVADIRAVFPGAQVLLWRHDLFRLRMARVVAALAGITTADKVDPVRGEVNAARHLRAADLIHRLRREDPALAGRALEARIAAAGPEALGAPPVFTPAQTAVLEERYARDIAALQAQAGILFADAD